MDARTDGRTARRGDQAARAATARGHDTPAVSDVDRLAAAAPTKTTTTVPMPRPSRRLADQYDQARRGVD